MDGQTTREVRRVSRGGSGVWWCSRLLLVLLCASAARAQDTSLVRRTPQGVLVDFQDVDIRVVVTALAEAARLNLSYTDLPPKRVTLRMHQPVPESEIAALLRNIARSNGLTYTEENGLVRLAPATGPASAVAGPRTAADSAQEPVQMYIYGLKHARAAHMAATLQAVFGVRAAGAPSTPGLSQLPLSERLRGQAIPPTTGENISPVAPAPVGPVAALPAQLRGDIQIVPDETTNSLVVRALPADWATIRQAIEAMDLRPLQVIIEVVIAELRTTSDLEVGLSGKITVGDSGAKSGGLTLNNSVADDFVATLTQHTSKFTANLALAALASRGNVRILSRPLLLAQNNQEAKILVGEQRPFIQVFRSLPTEQAVSDQVVQYRDVATTLTLRPTINPDNYVNLQVQQEVSTATDVTQFGAPIISTREASTWLFVKDGQTVMLGGLVSHETDRVKSGIPILSSIPFLGNLFGSRTEKGITNELFLFLTPHVITTDADAERLRDSLQHADTTIVGRRPPP